MERACFSLRKGSNAQVTNPQSPQKHFPPYIHKLLALAPRAAGIDSPPCPLSGSAPMTLGRQPRTIGAREAESILGISRSKLHALATSGELTGKIVDRRGAPQ
jgi:hypothetical protein